MALTVDSREVVEQWAESRIIEAVLLIVFEMKWRYYEYPDRKYGVCEAKALCLHSIMASTEYRVRQYLWLYLTFFDSLME